MVGDPNSPSGVRFTSATERETAVQLVESRPEVAEWRRFFTGPDGKSPHTGGRPCIEVCGKQSNGWLVHVYEEVRDNPRAEGRTATLNWYRVDVPSRTVTAESDFDR